VKGQIALTVLLAFRHRPLAETCDPGRADLRWPGGQARSPSKSPTTRPNARGG
jgi:hypothetical protein